MSDEHLHYDLSAFRAQRERVAQTIDPVIPQLVALPGALAPIDRVRLEAHQEDGLLEHQIVAYENERFMDATAGRREQHARWVRRDYDAQVQAHREIEADRMRKEMEVAAAYQHKLAEILARKDAEDA